MDEIDRDIDDLTYGRVPRPRPERPLPAALMPRIPKAELNELLDDPEVARFLQLPQAATASEG